MKIAFRIDMGLEIGMGHYMRMSALADAFVELGHECVFFTEKDEPVDYSGFGVIVLDTYRLSDKYIETLRVSGRILVCCDDNALYTYCCDVLLNHNFHAHELEFRFSGERPKLLLGSKYALLRSEFSKAEPIVVKDKAVNIFVCFGGSDVRNFTPVAIQALCGIPDIQLTVVLGSHTKCNDEVYALESPNVAVLKNPDSISKIMQSCDIAVTAAGSMVYELAALGIPSVLISQADNQLKIAEFLNSSKLMKWLGSWSSTSSKELLSEVEVLLNDKERRKAEHRSLLQTVDRNGARNVAVAVLNIVKKAAQQ